MSTRRKAVVFGVFFFDHTSFSLSLWLLFLKKTNSRKKKKKKKKKKKRKKKLQISSLAVSY